MRIFYASDNSPNVFIRSELWRKNLLLSLLDLGYDVVEFKYDFKQTFCHLDKENGDHKQFIEKNRPKVTQVLLKQIYRAHRQKPINLFLSYFYDACVLPEAIDEIRSLGITAVNWFCNGSYQFHLVSEISPHYDWCLVPERFRLKDYESIGARPIYCQEAANPSVYRKYDVPFEHGVTFIGQAYGERPAYIKHLLDNGIDVRVWGFGWERHSCEAMRAPRPNLLGWNSQIGRKLLTVGGWRAVGRRLAGVLQRSAPSDATQPMRMNDLVYLPQAIMGGILSDDEMIRMFSRSRINLGFSSCGSIHDSHDRIVQVRLRDFEIPMSGGFYLVEYMEELEEFFDIGKEIACYSDPEDLVDKIRYYLIHDNEREKIRRAGFERCQRDHSWHKRFEMAFREMGLV